MPFPKQNFERFTEADISAVSPRQPGVYGIFNFKQYIYVGKTQNLREHLLRHVRGESEQAACIYKYGPTQWVFVTATIGQLNQMEISLKAEYKPVCNPG